MKLGEHYELLGVAEDLRFGVSLVALCNAEEMHAMCIEKDLFAENPFLLRQVEEYLTFLRGTPVHYNEGEFCDKH